MLHRFSQSLDDFDMADALAAAGLPSFRSDMEREHPLLQQHDVESADLRMAVRVGTEFVYAGGAQVEIFLRTDNADYDRVWDEDPNPTYWQGILRKAFFAPKPLEIALKYWGSDTPVKLEIFFSLADIVQLFGDRVLRSGDVIKVPYNAVGNAKPKYFRVITASPDGNYRYTWIYLKCTMESLTADITVLPEPYRTHLRVADQQEE